MTREYNPEFQQTCPCCGQPVLKIPLEYQCEYSGCEELGEYDAWFNGGMGIIRLNVCEGHLKLSKGYKVLIEQGMTHQKIMDKLDSEMR